MDTVKDLLEQNIIRLPSPPNVALRLMETIKQDQFSFAEVAEIIQYDPALTAKVLKVVNSAFYSFPERIGSIEQALKILGVHIVKNIVFSFNLVDGLKISSTDIFKIDYFWKRSIIAAIGTEQFATFLKVRDDDLYVSALLKDLGILILHSNYQAKYSRLIEEKDGTGVPIAVLEKREFGFDHQDLCSEVLKQWRLPEKIYIPINYHHNYGDAPEEHRTAARILFLANALSSIFSDVDSYGKIKYFSELIQRDLHISDISLEELVDGGAEKVVGVCSVFHIDSNDIKPLAILLQEANEGLSNLNLSYEKLVSEYRKEKLQAEIMARELLDTNEKLNEANRMLKEQADRDHLTGLHNRRYLFNYLNREFMCIQRYGEHLSVMIFDIDFFKKVNDRYGHQHGDLVLQAISAKAAEIKRGPDLLARYGGEEFIMVMPRTALEGALAIAERLRTGIEQLKVPVDGEFVQVTISIGVASCGPESRDPGVDRLFSMADQAMYNAKKRGRNRVVAAASGVPQAARGFSG